MSFEQIKTQVLLLHSQQSALDTLSTGFNDSYAVHCATSGTEALNTLTETPIHVIVSAHDLPGMSGLDALREAKKRSPDTITILLAGNDANDGLEALVGDKEVFQIVRGEISPQALKDLIDNATKTARLMALSQSANDTQANVDQPYGEAEHIVMETAANGSVIISDGTGQVPILKPEKVQGAPSAAGQHVDVLVLTKDEEFLTTIKESSRGMHNVHHAVTPSQAEEIVRDRTTGVLVTDAAMVGSNIEALTQRLRTNVPRLVAIVAGRRDDGELLMDLINRGHVYRFLLKPVSPGRARLAIEASVKHHLEAADSAFKGKPRAAAPPPARPAAPAPAPQPVPAPARAAAPAQTPAPAKQQKKAAPVKAAPKTAPKPRQKVEPKISTATPPPAAPAQKPNKITPTLHATGGPGAGAASPVSDGLDDAFDEASSFTETMTGIAISVGKSISGAAESLKPSKRKDEPAPEAPASAPMGLDSLDGGGPGLLSNPRLLAIAGGVVVIAIVAIWMFVGGDDVPADTGPDAVEAEADTTVTEPGAEPATGSVAESGIRESEVPPAVESRPVAEPAPSTAALVDQYLAQAREAIASGNVYSPAGQNAVEYYIAARDTAPNNLTVSDELDALIEDVFSQAETALLENRSTDASRALRVIALADPGNPRLNFMNAQLEQQQLRGLLDEARAAIRDQRFEDAGRVLAQAESIAGANRGEVDALSAELASARSDQRLDDVLGLATERLDADMLTAPANDNARYYFELAQTIDPQSAAAQQGLIAVASKLVLGARESIDAGNFAAAEALLEDARSLDPDSSELAASTSALVAARERQATAERQIELDREQAERRAALERQAEADRLAQEQQAAAERLAAQQQAAEPASASSPAGGDASVPATAAAMLAATNPGSAAEAAAGAGADTESAADDISNQIVSISSLQRITYVPPRYPRGAQRRNISGYADIEFTVQTDGSVANVGVTQSEPRNTFDRAAVEAVEQWEFEPVIENGQAVERRVAVRMSFSLQ